MKTDVKIQFVEDAEKKAMIVSEVLLDLPEWFGLSESTQSYIDESRELPLWVAKTDDLILGFITLATTSKDTVEIHSMGVKKDYHRKGIGRLLYEYLEKYTRQSFTFLQVKTVDEGHYDEYDQTISFYESLGFKRLEVFPDLWDEWNPCLILIKFLQQK